MPGGRIVQSFSQIGLSDNFQHHNCFMAVYGGTNVGGLIVPKDRLFYLNGPIDILAIDIDRALCPTWKTFDEFERTRNPSTFRANIFAERENTLRF